MSFSIGQTKIHSVYPAPTKERERERERERKQSDASEGSDVGDPVRVAEDKSKVRRDVNGERRRVTRGSRPVLMPKHPNSSVNKRWPL